MRYVWGFKKDIPHRGKGDPPKLLIRHLELIGQSLPGKQRSYEEYLSFMNEITMGWHPCIKVSELVSILDSMMVMYNIEGKN